MLYESLSQPTIFLLISLAGFASGFIFDFKTLLLNCFKENKYLNQISAFFACFLTLSIFFIVNLKINYGQFRLFIVISFLISFYTQRFIMNNFVANTLQKCYNKLKEKYYGRKNARRNRKNTKEKI